MDVRTLIVAYRKGNPAPGREDTLHAQWWTQHLGEAAAASLTAARLLEGLDRLASYGRSPSTVNLYFRFFRRVCAWGVREEILPADPCAGIPLPKQPKPALRVLTSDEEASLCVALGRPYNVWMKIALETGLKLSEQFSLRWRDLNLVRATALLPDPSSGAAFVLPLPPAAVDLFQQLRRSQPPSLYCFPDLKTPHRPVNVHSFLSWRWGRAVQEAGIPAITWKDLRSTYGVRLAERGHTIEDVVARLRQAGPKRAYLYRCTAEQRPPKAVPEERASMYQPLVSGELSAVLSRDLQARPVIFEEAARLYAVHQLAGRPSRPQFERIVRQFWQSWATRPLGTLIRKEIKAWHLEQRHIPIHANKALTFLKALLNWSIDVELMTCANPAFGIKRFPAPPRERYLSTDEWQRVIQGLPLLSHKIRGFLLILLLTGARGGEARQMRWSHIDKTARIWTKPKTKNNRSHRVPLPSQVMRALDELPRISDWVFPGMTCDRPWSATATQKVWADVRRRWGLTDVTLHDFRRSCASKLVDHGENLSTIQATLNHHSLTPTAIYARLSTATLDRALQEQANRLERLSEPQVCLPTAPNRSEKSRADQPLVIIEATTKADPPIPLLEQETEGRDEWPGVV